MVPTPTQLVVLTLPCATGEVMPLFAFFIAAWILR